MINITLSFDKIKRILHKSLDFNTYILLKFIEAGELDEIGKYWTNTGYNIPDKLLEMTACGFVNIDNKLTKRGKETLQFIDNESISINFLELHKRLQEEMIKLTGKKQKTLQGRFPFLCNWKDLAENIAKVAKKYGELDAKKTEKVLISYVNRCFLAKFEHCQLVYYYLIKDGNSNFFTDYEGFEEKQEPKEYKTVVDI